MLMAPQISLCSCRQIDGKKGITLPWGTSTDEAWNHARVIAGWGKYRGQYLLLFQCCKIKWIHKKSMAYTLVYFLFLCSGKMLPELWQSRGWQKSLPDLWFCQESPCHIEWLYFFFQTWIFAKILQWIHWHLAAGRDRIESLHTMAFQICVTSFKCNILSPQCSLYARVCLELCFYTRLTMWRVILSASNVHQQGIDMIASYVYFGLTFLRQDESLSLDRCGLGPDGKNHTVVDRMAWQKKNNCGKGRVYISHLHLKVFFGLFWIGGLVWKKIA